MGKRLRAIRERLSIPSGRAIIHIIVVEIIINSLWNWVSGMFAIPLIREIGFLVLIIAVLFAVAWYLPKLSPRFSGASVGKGSKQNISTDYEKRYADWMTTAIQEDVRDLPSCILVNEPHICWEHLKEREDAYVEFNFGIWSSSVHLLEISKQVEGHICFQGGELERIPEITQKASQLSHLRRSRDTQLIIRQWLSFPVKGRMETEYGSQVEFDFSKVNIPVVATLPDGSPSATCRLPIPDVVCVQMPEHPNAPVPDTGGSQT
jgi:hypothetical protein